MRQTLIASLLSLSLVFLVGCSQPNADQGTINFDIESTAPQFVEYNEATLEAADGQRPYVLFFHAKWCIICQAVEDNVMADFESFPEQTLFIRADYDKEVRLKRDYGVNYQSTLVFVDTKGEIIDRQIGPDNAQIVKSINLTL